MANIRHALALRARAVHVITTVFAGRALDAALDQDRERHGRHGLVEELAIGTIRQALGLGAIVSPLLKRPFKKADQDIYALVLMGLYQARNMDSPEAVTVSEAVATTEALGKPWARGVVNAVLRAALTNKVPCVFAASNHPSWFVARLQKAWPDDWLSILEANDRRAPLALRVDTQQISREDYLKQLAQIGTQATLHPVVPSAIMLSGATPILELPGFREGLVSVQDAAAQCAAWLVAPQAGDTVLDACAAPGGKTGHLAQACPDARITAVDRDPARVVQLCDTLTRLQRISDIQILTLDLTTTEVPGTFQRILLDAPCSATGVIRRHPDIKLHRRAEDLDTLRRTQALLLDHLWQNLAPWGTMVYATCSVLPEENDEQVADFLRRTQDAAETALSFPIGRCRQHGWQFLPGESDMDGFYYARFIKHG